MLSEINFELERQGLTNKFKYSGNTDIGQLIKKVELNAVPRQETKTQELY